MYNHHRMYNEEGREERGEGGVREGEGEGGVREG